MRRTSARFITTLSGWRPSAILHALDMALVDPPSLCCDDDQLCQACRAEGRLRER